MESKDNNVSVVLGDCKTEMGNFLKQAAMQKCNKITYRIEDDGEGSKKTTMSATISAMECDPEDYRNFKLLMRAQHNLENVFHSVTVNVMSKDGKHCKYALSVKFPLLCSGYDEYRSKHVFKRDLDWWLQNKQVVMTDRKHLPTLKEKERLSEVQHRVMQQNITPRQRDHPRPHCLNPPNETSLQPVLLQGSLESPLPFDDKTIFNVVIKGLDGTDGTVFTSENVTGRHIRERMDAEFKHRKQFLQTCHRLADANGEISFHQPLVSGSAFAINNSVTLQPLQCIVPMIHLAWTSHNVGDRKLCITGIMAACELRRNRIGTNGTTLVLCKSCLDIVQEDCVPWTCKHCSYQHHPLCFDQWQAYCMYKGCTITCPSCQHRV